MQVILRQTVENLGRPGDIVKVKPGYAHNYLIPQGMAMIVTEGNVKRIEDEKRILAIKEAKLKEEAEIVVKEYAGTELVFEMKAGIEGVLYGSVTSADIAEALAAKGLEVDKRRLLIPEAIKRIGEFEVSIRLHPEVDLAIKILVKSDDGMAEKAMAEAAKAAEEAAQVEEAPEAAPEAEETAEESTEEA